jgi:hypothetical protein
MSNYMLPGVVVSLILFVFLVALCAFKQPRLLLTLLAKLLALLAAVALNVPAVFGCFFGTYGGLGILPNGPGDSGLGEGMACLGIGYCLSLAGTISFQAYSLLVFFVGHGRGIARALTIGSAIVLLGIIAIMMIFGLRWQGGLPPMLLYGFLVVQFGFWMMFSADAIAQWMFRTRSRRDVLLH